MARLTFEPGTGRVLRVLSKREFLKRLGDTCVIAMEYAAFQNTTTGAALRARQRMFDNVADVDPAEADTIDGVDALIAAGLLDASRRSLVLDPVGTEPITG